MTSTVFSIDMEKLFGVEKKPEMMSEGAFNCVKARYKKLHENLMREVIDLAFMVSSPSDEFKAWTAKMTAEKDEKKKTELKEQRNEEERKRIFVELVKNGFEVINDKEDIDEANKEKDSDKQLAIRQSEGVLSVENALKELSVEGAVIDLMKKDMMVFMSFGKKTSHTLRAKLFFLFQTAQLQDQEKFLVYFLFSQVKNKNRVVEGIDNMPKNLRTHASFVNVKKFINKYIVQYTPEEKLNSFAAVHLPNTNPGIDCLCALLSTPKELRSVEMLSERQTFCQLNIDKELLAETKEFQKNFWLNQVTKTNRDKAAGEKWAPEFKEEFFNTAAADKYLLVDSNLTTIPPSDKDSGYTRKEIEVYVQKVEDWFSSEE